VNREPNLSTALEVPFLDLKAAYRELAPEINRAGYECLVESAQLRRLDRLVENCDTGICRLHRARYAVESLRNITLELALKLRHRSGD